MSYADVVSRVSQIQGQLASLGTAFDPSTAAAATQSTAGTGSTGQTFASTLQQAQGVGTSAGVIGHERFTAGDREREDDHGPTAVRLQARGRHRA